MKRSALEGVRIADFCWLWAGSYATGLLAFLGAEVIKIESMQRVDPSRMMTLTIGQSFEGVDHSPVFNSINLNKMSAKLNLKHPKGIELAKKIIQISDVVSQNMRPGAMEKMGLGYDVLKEVKPDIIMLSSSAFGAEGPLKRYGGYAPSFAAYSGVTHLTGYSDGPPNPMTGSTDLMSATTSAFAIIAALNYRQHTGKGQHIDLSSVESLAVFTGDALMDYIMNSRVQSRKGNRDNIMAPHNCYRCRGDDKWVSIAIATEEEWQAFCRVIGNPAWAGADKFSDAYNRWKNQYELDALVTEWTVNYTHYEVTEMLQKVGVAAMPSFSNQEIFSDPHFKERKLAVEVEHPAMGKQVVLGPPWRLSETPAKVTKASPVIGENDEYVFGELLGMPVSEIKQLIAEQVIY
ncbi:MAG TPA: CoA transferase [Dehalococcoidia bacterium]|nr:CoA transferase [Dehalococcoidia bacterium]